MMKKYKYKFGSGLAWYENKDVRMLEKMAAKGYTLEKINKLGFYRFRAATPEECTYSVDFSDIVVKNEGFQQYVEIFNAGGWEYVASMVNVHFFKAPKGTKPIYTDGISMAEKYETMQKMSMWWVVASGIFVAICAALYAILSLSFFRALIAIGVCLFVVAFQSMLLNRLRAIRFRKSGCTAIELMEKSGVLGLNILLIVGIATLLALSYFRIIPHLGVFRIGLISGILGLSISNVWNSINGFIDNKREAKQLKKSKK